MKIVSRGEFEFSRFPRSILSLRNLRRLTIHSNHRIVNSPLEWRSIINLLPPTLERLKLCFPESEMSLLDYAPHATEDDLAYIYKQYPQGQSRLVDIGALFPHLHTLKIDNGILKPSDLLVLPSTLTFLSLGNIQYELQLMSLLPRSLTHLDVDLDLSKVDRPQLAQDWVLAPPDLHTITSMTFSENDASFLPLSLTETNLQTKHAGPSPEFVRSLPRNLHTLCILIYDREVYRNNEKVEQLFEALPSTLVKLQLAKEGDPKICLSVPLIRNLPSSLRILIAPCDIDSVGLAEASLDAAGNRITNIWPPSLESLHTSPRGLYDTPSSRTVALTRFLQSLPQTLTDLRLDAIHNFASMSPPILDTTLLPPRITSFTIRILATIVGTFPTSLTSLDAMTQMSHNISSFPDSLRSLTLHIKSYGKLPTLPSSLLMFSASSWSTEWFKLIPKSVTHLHIKNLKHASGAEDCFHMLPSSLQTLKVGKGVPIDEYDFSSLINLKTLVFPTLLTSNIPTLPRGLHTLRLKKTTITPVQVAAELPRHLRCIQGINWRDSNKHNLALVQHFPPFAITYLPIEQEFDEVLRARLRDAF